MKLFSVSQVKAWDQYTIRHEPVSSIDLMERAAGACYRWIKQNYDTRTSFTVFCGRGNNGGDGLAIARMLVQDHYKVVVYVVGENRGSADFEKNFERLSDITNEVYAINNATELPYIKGHTVIDAIFGTGLNKNPGGIHAAVIRLVNRDAGEIISVDIPSGMFADKYSGHDSVINSNFTLTFQTKKLAFLMAENAPHTGKVVTLNIGLSGQFVDKEKAAFEIIDENLVRSIYKPRKEFSHKGNFGYACLLAGSYGMMGAAVLSAEACLRSGAGKLNCFIPKSGYNIMQQAVPEAMCTVFGKRSLKEVSGFQSFDAIGVGPGIGREAGHKKLLTTLFKSYDKPLVIDADALNILAKNQSLLKKIPAGSILTPHPKEFERLFGKPLNDFDLMRLALAKAKMYDVLVIVKGHYTFIATPNGKGYFNANGNAGMATAGSGDVLTGIITGLLAQKYTPLEAALLGPYLHGLAGDIAADTLSPEAMLASDITANLGAAYREIAAYNGDKRESGKAAS